MQNSIEALALLALTLGFAAFGAGWASSQSKEAEEHFQSAKSYQVQKRFLEAVTEYQQVLRLQPEHERASISLAMVLSQMGRKAEAENLCNQQLRNHPRLFKLHLTLASFLIPEERYNEAGSHIQAFFERATGQVPETAPERIYGLYLLAINLIAQKKPEEGEQRLLEVVKFDPQFMEAHMELGELYSQSKQTYEKAVHHFSKVTELKPQLATAHQKLGKVLLNLEKNQQAIEHLAKAVELAPSLSEAYFSLATAYRKQGDLEKSQELIARFQALEQEKETQKQKRRKALTLYQDGEKHVSQGELSAALKLFQQCRDLVPERSPFDYIFPPDRSYYGLAFVSLLQKNYPEAAKSIEAAIQLYPYDPRYYELYAHCLDEGRNYSDAIRMIERAIQLNPVEASYLNFLGNLLFKVAQYQNSVFAYRRAVELEPQNPNYHLNLSSALAKAGNTEESQKEKELYLRLLRQN